MNPVFQMNNKLTGKRVLENTELTNTVAEEQHGSRKHHQAGLLALNKVLIEDLSRLMVCALCYAMYDAIGCFDRIDHTPAILVLTKYGLKHEPARILFQVIQKAMHSIKTGYGVSDHVYGNKIIPLAGCGQGNGLGPTLWALISSVVIDMCKEAGHDIEIATAITKMILSLMGFAFVDNADLAQAAPDQDTSKAEMINDFQEFMERWEGGIRASGGAICQNKTKWFLIDYV